MSSDQRFLGRLRQVTSTAGSSAAAAARAAARHRLRWGFPEFFLISQIIAPAVLFLPGTQPLRVVIRMFPFVISLGALLVYGKKAFYARLFTPAQRWLVLCSIWITLMIFHPTTNSLLAGGAHAAMYISVLAPIFWAPHTKLTTERLQRLLFIVLICSGINSVVGILQVYDPAKWMPQQLSSVITSQLGGVEALSYIRRDGTVIIRPTGLSDSPGAVAGPAIAAALLGLVFCLERIRLWRRLVALLSVVAGLTVIFLSQVRVSLLVTCGALVAYLALLLLQGQKRKAVLMLVLGTAMLSTAFFAAVELGGQSIEDRFLTLVADNPVNVYYENRGAQVAYAFDTLLFEYPVGAGLGRWGMMRGYFGDESNLASPPIWAEIQPNAWILDGGLALVLFYSMAVLTTLYNQIKMVQFALSLKMKFVTCAIVAVNLVAVALIFGYTPFNSQMGVQYWFLSGALLSAYSGYDS